MDCSLLPLGINELSILFTDDTEIQKLNASYRGKDKATDVLSFSYIEGVVPSPFETKLGDLVISVDTLLAQAKRYKATPSEEAQRLIVHGILHLFGFDHEKVPKSVAVRMRRLERKTRLALKKGPKTQLFGTKIK